MSAGNLSIVVIFNNLLILLKAWKTIKQEYSIIYKIIQINLDRLGMEHYIYLIRQKNAVVPPYKGFSMRSFTVKIYLKRSSVIVII